MIDILVVGQTPPPFHGQALMVEGLLKGSFSRIRLDHVRCAFSRESGEVGLFRVHKLTHLITVIARIIFTRFRHRAKILYYCPGGPSRVPIYRDIILLGCTRWLFRKIIFHIHAAGISEFLKSQPACLRTLYKAICGCPDTVIQLSELSPPDGVYLDAKRVVVIPNGIEDKCGGRERRPSDDGGIPRILFVGALRRTKGVMILLKACSMAKQRGIVSHLDLMGKPDSEEFEDEIKRFVVSNSLSEVVTLLGERTGDDKWQTYSQADLFCFPSFYEAEGMPLVVLEAMQFALPVVATRWRGIPSMVQDGETGYLVPTENVETLADALVKLLADGNKRRGMGERARHVFLEHFTIGRWRERMENVMVETVEVAVNKGR